jgi:hypothetical protein
MRRRGVQATTGLLTALLLAALPGPASPQTLAGLVIDRMNEAPVGGAVVSLMGRDGARRAEALSDADGRFTIAPPWAGEFYLVVHRYSYADLRSPLLALGTEGETPIQLVVDPAPIRLDGLQVSVEDQAADELRGFGLTPDDLGDRWIDRPRIDDVRAMADVGSIIEGTSVPGTRVTRDAPSGSSGGNARLCVTLDRGRADAAGDRCALMILDGVPVRGEGALMLDPMSIAGIAVLQPTEASAFYGGLGGGGAVLLWSRR